MLTFDLKRRHTFQVRQAAVRTSWICCSRSSRQLSVSCCLFRLSRREMSCAANSSGFSGTISLGGRRVRWGERRERGHPSCLRFTLTSHQIQRRPLKFSLDASVRTFRPEPPPHNRHHISPLPLPPLSSPSSLSLSIVGSLQKAPPPPLSLPPSNIKHSVGENRQVEGWRDG